MSENSLSLHFWRTSPPRVREVAQLRGGTIVASNDDWLCLVPLDQGDEEAIVTQAEGLVLKWLYNEDYALSLELFEGGENVGRASFVWGAVIREPPSANLPPEFVSKLRGLGVAASKVEEIERVAHDVGAGGARGHAVRDRIALALGLAAYEWLSPETCIELPVAELQKSYPQAEEIEPPS